MTEGLVTALSYLSAFIGFSSTFCYLATFYLTPYNQLYLSGESGYDETDVSYTIAIVECVLSGCTFIIGLLAFAAPKYPERRVVLISMLFFIMAVIVEGTFGTVRAWNLGLLGGDMERTCSDKQFATGCPTTRYEAVHSPREILYTSPKGGDCQFWFWDEMRSRQSANACSTQYGQPAICDYSIETFMDWSSPSSYGWRDDPDEIQELLADSGPLTTMKKVHNMAELLKIQAGQLKYNSEEKNYSSTISTQLTVQPSLAYCWYWGCNAVCNSHRYFVNRLWFVATLLLTVLYLLNTMLAACLWRKTRKIKVVPAVVEPSAFIMPEFGRRKRQLVENPAMLQF